MEHLLQGKDNKKGSFDSQMISGLSKVVPTVGQQKRLLCLNVNEKRERVSRNRY